MQMLKKRRAITAAVAALAIGALAYFHPFSLQELRTWGEKTALLSVGMQQPRNAVLALSEELRGAPPAQSSTTTSASVSTTTSAGTSAATSTRITNAPAPPQSQNGGTVLEQVLSTGTPVVENIAWANRCGKDLDIAAQFAHLPDITIKDGSEPQVLIVHTHTTESYMNYYAGYYNDDDVARTKDTSQSVVAVGEAIAAQLRAAGIEVIHDTTVHDSPQYTGAYDRSAETIQKNLKKYPTIQVVLDIHRDAVMPDDTTKIKPTVTIDGRKAAQVMIIAGAVSTEDQPHPNWQENLRLALQLQNELAGRYEDLARPLSVVASRYNQHLTKGSLLIEVGTDANTIAESVYSGELVGKTLADVLSKLKE